MKGLASCRQAIIAVTYPKKRAFVTHRKKTKTKRIKNVNKSYFQERQRVSETSEQ